MEEGFAMLQLQSSHIYLRNLRFHAYHGVLPQERVVGNDYVIDLRIDYSVERAMQTDHVEDTINYAEVFSLVAEEMAVSNCLLERVGWLIARRLTVTYPAINGIELDIRKLNPPMGADCDGAGVHFHFINKK